MRIAVMSLALAAPAAAATPDTLADFNARFEQATRQMDNAALAALWDPEGISLLPDAPPMIGKATISAFVERVTAQFPGAQMRSFTLRCEDPVEADGLASEWCFEHQVVELDAGRTFDGRGRLLLVLRRGADGQWLLLREMWIPAGDSSD